MKRRSYYGMALLVFVLTMILMNGTAIMLSAGCALFALAAEGGSGTGMLLDYLMNNLNLFSCLVYLVTGTVFLLWYYFAIIEPEGVNRYAAAQTRKLSPVCFAWLVLFAFAVLHVISLVLVILAAVSPSAMENYTELVESSGMSEYSPVWAAAVLILPPLVEEVIFRGLIMHYMKKAGACFIVANLIQAVLFGVFHMNLVQGIYAAILGFILGYLAWRYESLAVPMVMHALFNFYGTVLTELESRFLPDIVYTLLVLACIPLAVVIFVMIHFGIGEKKKGNN